VPAGSWRRPAYWAAVALAALAVAGGVILATTGSAARTGPGATVLAYFAALEDGDAGAALGYGAVPRGSRDLLTPAVLAEQQRIAPISEVRVLSARPIGSRAVVRVRYLLSFAAGQHIVTTRVRLRRDGTWRMREVAMRTRLRVAPAGQRATLAGADIPRRPVLLFPGVAPIRFDVPYLAVGPSASVTFGSPGRTLVRPSVSRVGQLAAVGAVTAALHRCLAPHAGSHASPACPLPAGRVVPGSVRARALGRLGNDLQVRLGSSPAGVLDVNGHVSVRGRYQQLTFRNQVERTRGRIRLAVRAQGYAAVPLRMKWAP
jgi:hypothetical protein